MELCECSVCIGFQFLDNDGQRRPGRYLSSRNVAKHQLEEYYRVQATLPVPSPGDSSVCSSPSPSETESELSSIITEQNPLSLFIILFVSWLHLCCNVSRENCKTAIQMIINILQVALKHSNLNEAIGTIPRDPRTMIERAGFEVELTEKICCRVCFRLYELDPTTHWRCDYKQFSHSDPCNEELFIKKKIYLGHQDLGDLAYYSKPPVICPTIIGTPRCTFLSQPILTWVTWLLSRPDTEKEIEDWIQTNQDLKDQGYFSDVQHGENLTNTSWKERPNMLKLGVSLFVDWFNPRGNKISGKMESSGVLALSCLNLPPTIRNKLSHMCIAGITPGPYQPDPQTFNHLLKPLVDELIQLNSGLIIPTHQFPAGRFVQIKLLAVYGDVLATKKVVGYAAHSATKFCSFCHAEQAKIPLLQLSRQRLKEETISSARSSKAASSSAAQDAILKATGVRWSELNRLPYWDPSKHVVLGVMHNWLEGILQGHFRYRWRFGLVSPDQSKKKRRNGSRATDGPSKRIRVTMQSIELAMDIDDEDIASLSDDDDDDDEDICLNGGFGGSFFTENDVEQFRTGMKQVVLPPGVPHLPANLGEASHGKLSASQWHALFVFIIPLVICELYVDQVGTINLRSDRYKFLANTASLVQCTNVVFARKFKAGDMKRFQMHYEKYSQSVGELFEDVKVQPNHHFSLHIPQQMSAWGPLAGVSEFPGERLIGFLQKINTNNKIDEMHRSMMNRGCQLQRMMANDGYIQFSQGQDKGKQTREHKKKTIRLLASRYNLLFNLVASHDQGVLHRDTFPVPRNRWILSGDATPVQSINCNGLAVGSMSPRNCVVANVGGTMRYGLVQQCYQYRDRGGEVKEVLVVATISNLYPKTLEVIQTRPFRYLLFLFGVVVGRVEAQEEVFMPSQVVSLAAYRLLEKDTFSIPQNGIALVPRGYDALLNISGHE